MARIVVASLPFAGHAGPLAALSRELLARGHDVVAYTGAKYQERFGAEWLPWSAATDFDDADLAATFPRIGNGKGHRADRANVDDILFGTAPGQAADLVAEHARKPFDLLVTDHNAFGGALAGEALGIPWATVSVVPLTLTTQGLPPLSTAIARQLTRFAARWLIDPRINRIRASAGLMPVPHGGFFDPLYSPHLVLAQGVTGLDYPRPDLPAHVHYLGRMSVPPRAAAVPAWWPEVAESDRPVVHVTQGTLDRHLDELVRPTIEALADSDILLVCTTGGEPPEVLGPLPGNVRAAAFLPHDRLLPLTSAMVTNGGFGGVLAALEAGVPLVVAGDTLDKPEVARRVAWSGAGLDLRTGSPGARRIAAAVHEVLGRPEMRRRAAALSAEITAAGGAGRAADLVETLPVDNSGSGR